MTAFGSGRDTQLLFTLVAAPARVLTHVSPLLPHARFPQMVFHRNCLGRGMIEYGAESDARRGFDALVDDLKRMTLSRTSVETLAAAVTLSPPSSTYRSNPTAGAAIFEKAGLFDTLCAFPDGRTAALFAVSIGLLFLAAVVHSASVMISRELRAVASAMQSNVCSTTEIPTAG